MRALSRCWPGCVRAAVAGTVVFAFTLAVGERFVFAQAKATYLHTLSGFSGPLRYDGMRISVDLDSGETFTLYQNIVRIFNASGMEVFSFGDGLDLGQILDVAAVKNGDIILLSLKDSRTLVTRCDYRGVPVGPFVPSHLPAALAFSADRMVYHSGALYFASLSTLSVIVTDTDGRFRSHVEFLPSLEADDRRDGLEASGFAVDHESNLYFTVPVLFKVFKRTSDGALTSFGKPGSGTGRFGIVAGIASDRQGHLYVVDKLKCVVMVFDRGFNFVGEFGYRGAAPENLIAPDDVAVDRTGRIYVAQARRRGVSVFSIGPR